VCGGGGDGGSGLHSIASDELNDDSDDDDESDASSGAQILENPTVDCEAKKSAGTTIDDFFSEDETEEQPEKKKKKTGTRGKRISSLFPALIMSNDHVVMKNFIAYQTSSCLSRTRTVDQAKSNARMVSTFFTYVKTKSHQERDGLEDEITVQGISDILQNFLGMFQFLSFLKEKGYTASTCINHALATAQ